MRCMKQNQVPFFYALFIKTKPVEDEYRNETSEHEVIYANPVACRANISAARGETQARQFGENVAYDKVIVMEADAPAIDEYSVLWIDRMPQLDANGALAVDNEGAVITPYDYVVRKVAKSLNSVSFAVSKVSVSG